MNYEHEINELKMKVANLTEAFLNAQRNQVPVTAKVDDTANKVVEITPYTQMVDENSAGIFDLADLTDENSTAIFDIADLVDEHDERITALEERSKSLWS